MIVAYQVDTAIVGTIFGTLPRHVLALESVTLHGSLVGAVDGESRRLAPFGRHLVARRRFVVPRTSATLVWPLRLAHVD